MISIRCKKPSERWASATKPSGALSFRLDITAAPTLRNCPLDLTHFESRTCPVGTWTGFVLQTLHFARQITRSDFLVRLQNAFPLLLPPKLWPALDVVFSDLISRYATSASYDLKEITLIKVTPFAEP